MSSSVKGTIRLVTTVNLVLKLMHHMSAFCCIIFTALAVSGVVGEFNVATETPGGCTAGTVLGTFGVGALELVAGVVGMGLLGAGEIPPAAVIQ